MVLPALTANGVDAHAKIPTNCRSLNTEIYVNRRPGSILIVSIVYVVTLVGYTLYHHITKSVALFIGASIKFPADVSDVQREENVLIITLVNSCPLCSVDI